jgi:DNA-binding response OmpR family regulator
LTGSGTVDQAMQGLWEIEGRTGTGVDVTGGKRMMGSGEILLVEDEAFIAIETKKALEEVGMGPVNVCSAVDTALAELGRSAPRAALLDFNLGKGETSEALARELLARGIPFAFLTGDTEATMELPTPLLDAPRFSKPCHVDDVVAWLQDR